MAMEFNGRFVDKEGAYDLVMCLNCGTKRTERTGVDVSKLKCNICKGDDNETDVISDD